MQDLFGRYITLARRWAWLVVLGMVLCGGASFVVSSFLHPVYQASATLVVTMKAADSAVDNVSASQEAALTYGQLLTNPAVLEPVLTQHPGMTLQQLSAMISVNAQSNTQLIELDVKNEDAYLATQLVNEIAQSFESYSQTQLPINVQVVPAQSPTPLISPKRLSNTVIGAFVGLGLALTLIVIFEWIDDLPGSLEEVQELLGVEVVAAIPRASRHQQLPGKELEVMPALVDAGQLVRAFLMTKQAATPLKLIMVTSALSGEGKSTVAVSLASLLAKSGKSVLLADVNMRKPPLDQHLQVDNEHGLSYTLQGEDTLTSELYTQAPDIPTLYTLTSEVPSANPAGLLQLHSVERLLNQLKDAPFDYIIFDTPPLLSVADAQLLALHMQAILLVVDGSKTPRRVLTRTSRVLERIPVAIRGAVINKNHGNYA